MIKKLYRRLINFIFRKRIAEQEAKDKAAQDAWAEKVLAEPCTHSWELMETTKTHRHFKCRRCKPDVTIKECVHKWERKKTEDGIMFVCERCTREAPEV